MNGKFPTNNPWSLPPGFRADQPAFNYEEHCRQSLAHNRNFDVDMAAMRSAQPFMPPFMPRFGVDLGLPIADFDYRLNDFPRAGLFGTCSFGSPITAHPLAHSFGIGPSITSPSTASMMDSLQLPPSQPPVLPSQISVIHRVPPGGSETNEKPPTLTVETYAEKEESPDFDQKPVFPEEKSNSARQLDEDGKAAKPTRRADERAFGGTFYPASLPLDMTSGNYMKREIHTPPILEHPADFSRHRGRGTIKKEYSPQRDCQVCLSTLANGLHFGARTCAACAAFFRRTISDDKKYVCKRNQRCHTASRDGTGYRKICRCCRMKRCIEIGMLPENVQHKRSHRELSPDEKIVGFDNFFPGFYHHIPSTDI